MANLQAGGGRARGGQGIGGKRVGRTRVTLAALLTSASFGVLSLAMPAAAQVRAESVMFDIPSQPINEALVAFARQAGARFVMPDPQFGNVRSNAVRGAYDRETALAELLRGTGVAARLENGAIVLQRSADASRATQRAAPDASEEPVQFAQVTPPRTSTTDAAAGGLRRASDEVDDDEKDRVVVVGTNIRGVYPSSSPVEIYTAEDIARTGATTTEQFIQKLPQNMGTRTQYAAGSVGTGDRLNNEAVAGVDLRGLGVGTTLVLLNGRRLSLSDVGRIADVSLIPASALERVELLTDGASAIYGSDAVGGVVNFVLRDDFDGAETRLSYGGVSNGNLRQGDFAQTFGRSWGSGHALASYSAYAASDLEIADRSYAAAAERGNLTPVDQRHNFLATLSQDLGERLAISGAVVWGQRDTKVESSQVSSSNPLLHSLTTIRNETTQSFANLGLDYTISDTLTASLTGSYSEVNVDSSRTTERYNLNPPTVGAPLIWRRTHEVTDVTAKLDGSVFSLPGGDARFSLGAGVLDENFDGIGISTRPVNGTIGRRTTYVFGELFLPLIGPAQAIPLMERLDLSLAARYTAYDDTSSPALQRDFGDNTDPKIGLLWSPVQSLGLRATYGTSFRAPSLVQLDETSASNLIIGTGRIPNVPGGPLATRIQLTGSARPDLRPETATTYTLGFDVRPADSGLRFSGTYYSISYSDRIAQAPTGGAAFLQTPELYPDVIFRPSSAAYIEQILRTTINQLNTTSVSLADPSAAAAALFAMPNVWIADFNQQNLALSEQDGFDLSLNQTLDTSFGELNFGGALSRILSYRQQASSNSLVVSVVDTATQPVDLRGRLYFGLSRGGFDGTLSANYVDNYANPLAAAGLRDIKSWTTIDLSLAYAFRPMALSSNDARISLSVQNLFDRDPPFVARVPFGQALFQPVGFDPTNANPLGRLVVLGVSMVW